MSIQLLKREHAIRAGTLIEELRSMTEQEEIISNVPEHDAKENEIGSLSAAHLEDNAGKEASEGSPRCGSHFPMYVLPAVVAVSRVSQADIDVSLKALSKAQEVHSGWIGQRSLVGLITFLVIDSRLHLINKLGGIHSPDSLC